MPDFSLQGLSALLRQKLGEPRYSAQIDTALNIAFQEHEGQFRELADEKAKPVPYIVHPVGVAILANEFLRYVTLDDTYDDIISVCLTHDLVEDTEVEPQALERQLSSRTAEIVEALTKDSLTDRLSRDQRNEILVRKIIAAGNTAMFIKICDHCHNISRPNQTPIRLLDKAIRKGHTTYLQFFENGRLHTDLKMVYIKRLQDAELALAKRRQVEKAAPHMWTLHEAITHCVQLSDKKVLETHDISDALLDFTNANFVKPAAVETFLKEAIFDAVPSMEQKIKATIRSQATHGLINLSKLPRSVKRSLDLPADEIYIVDFGTTAHSENTTTFVVGVDGNTAPKWLGVESLRVIVSYLSERMRFQERNKARALVMEVARLKLDLDLDDVQYLGLDKEHLQKLRRIMDLGEFVRRRTIQILELTIGAKLDNPETQFVKSRCKSPQSIVRKMRARGFGDISAINDIVGFRIVCLSLAETERVAKMIKLVIPKHLKSRECKIETHNSVGVEVESNAGYKALHIHYFIKSDLDPTEEVGCEFQIRTVFQDAWAQISHQLTYKAETKGSDELETVIFRLKELRDEADKLISKVVDI